MTSAYPVSVQEIKSDAARRRLAPLLDAVQHRGEAVKILRYDRTAAIMVSEDWYEQARIALGEDADGC